MNPCLRQFLRQALRPPDIQFPLQGLIKILGINLAQVKTDADRVRHAQNATYRFMTVMAGCLDGFEEASRALFAHDANAFAQRIADWPPDVQAHLAWLARDAFAAEATPPSA